MEDRIRAIESSVAKLHGLTENMALTLEKVADAIVLVARVEESSHTHGRAISALSTKVATLEQSMHTSCDLHRKDYEGKIEKAEVKGLRRFYFAMTVIVTIFGSLGTLYLGYNSLVTAQALTAKDVSYLKKEYNHAKD